MTAQVTRRTEQPTRPVTSAQKRRATAEVKALVAAIPQFRDHEYDKLAVVGAGIAAALGRAVHWAPGLIAGGGHVTVPVDDLFDLIGLLRPSAGNAALAAIHESGAAREAAAPDEYAHGGRGLCGCYLLAVVTVGHRPDCPTLEA